MLNAVRLCDRNRFSNGPGARWVACTFASAGPYSQPAGHLARRFIGSAFGMATKDSITTAIESALGKTAYHNWRIGLTHDSDERKKYWKETEKQSVNRWSQWQANSLSDAQDIESHFIKRGMKGSTGGELSATKAIYVYVF